MENQIRERLRALSSAVKHGGFVELTESKDGTVLWYRRDSLGTVLGTHPRACIDSLTNSATIFWIGLQGQLNSKTFRAGGALRDWLKLETKQTAER